MAKVSVIIPVYNTENYLKECLDSVTNQTLNDIEIICVNDGSTDGSLSILNDYAQKYPKIIVINQENKGVSSARNKGIEKACGEYIMFLDSDDYFQPQACETAYHSITSGSYDLGIFGHYILKGKRLKPKPVNDNSTDYINVWDKIFKTAFLKNNNIKFPANITTAEDIIFSYTVNFYNPKTVFINELLMVYRDARKGSSTENKLRQLRTDIDAFKYFSNTETYKSQPIENKLKVVNKFSELIGWLGSKIKNKKEKYTRDILLSGFCTIIESEFDNDNIDKITSYQTCKAKQKNKNNINNMIFSFESSDDMRHEILNILGIKLKITKNIPKNYEKLSKMYSNNVKKIQHESKKRKIRVAFYVNDVKWKCQNLFDLMKKSNKYTPFIIVGRHAHGTQEFEKQSELELLNIYKTYKKKNMEVYLAYHDSIGDIPLSEFQPDVIFYSRPWGIPKEHNFMNVAKFALTCYVPYFISNSPAEIEAGSAFQNLLWRYYVLNKDIVNEYTPVMKNGGKNLRVTGYPLLDSYSTPNSFEKKYIIYAPHWTVAGKFLRYATFEWNGDYILNYAKKHPELNWVFKPHPTLKGTLIETGTWSKERVEAYYNEWEKIGIKYEGADYFDLFKQSKVLITDCGSFLAEYMPTQNPVILLRSDKAVPYNFLAQKVTKYYYKAHNIKELETLFENVIIKGEDVDKAKRLKMLDELKLITNASMNILNDLNTEFDIQ